MRTVGVYIVRNVVYPACRPELDCLQWKVLVNSLRAYLQLMRFPAVFTAWADICLGYALTHDGWLPVTGEFGWLLLATTGLYLSGMVFNDVFDREQDARERPTRPIPSGRVSLMAAIRVGVLLMLAGIGAASLAGSTSLYVALAVAGCILLYDGVLNDTIVGPVIMGTCRTGNVLLGASLGGPLLFSWQQLPEPRVWIAISLGLYIAGVTWFARNEEGTSRPWSLTAAAGVINLGLLALVAWTVMQGTQIPDRQIFSVALLAVIVTINRRLAMAISSPTPARVQGTIRLMLLSLIMLNAVLVCAATGKIIDGLCVAALLIPATTVGKWIYVT